MAGVAGERRGTGRAAWETTVSAAALLLCLGAAPAALAQATGGAAQPSTSDVDAGGPGGDAGMPGSQGSGVGGGAGGTAGTAGVPHGGDGTDAAAFSGSGGGGGGGGYSGTANGDIASPMTGGDGGNGAGGDPSEADGGGGGGGGGGDGARISGTAGPVSVSAEVTGGHGGHGGGVGGRGGGGGGGGAGVVMQDAGDITVSAGVSGGHGGAHIGGNSGGGGGGAGIILEQGGALAIENGAAVTGGDGGYHGNGGTGVLLEAAGTITIASGTVAGGAGTGVGSGGAAITAAAGSIIVNTGTLQGGAGAGSQGGSSQPGGGTGSGGASGFVPNVLLRSSGGVGILGAAGGGIAIVNSGHIEGGTSSFGQVNAVSLFGDNNRVELWSGSTISGNVVVSGGANNTLVLGGTTNATFDVSQIGVAAQYQGFDAFEKTGSGTWTLSGATTALTPWTLNQGTLSISSDANLGNASGALTFDGGTLQVTGRTLNSLARDIVWGANGGGFDIAEANHVFGISQSLTGSGSLTKTGLGELWLTGTNSYAGGTTVSQGILYALTDTALGTGPLTVDAGGGVHAATIFGGSASAGSLAINLTNAQSNLAFYTGASAGDATINSNGTITFNDGTSAANAKIANGHRLIFDGTATAGNAVITSGSTGATYFSGHSTADGATILNSAGALVDISHLASGGIGIGSLSGDGAVYLGAKTLTLGGLGLNDTIGGVIQDGGNAGGRGGSLTKTGAGTLTLSGPNTYTGGTLVEDGALWVTATGALGSGPAVLNGADAASTHLVFAGPGVSAGNSQITMTNGRLIFRDGADADQATIVNNTPGSNLFFTQNSSAGSANILNSSNAGMALYDTATAANATITNHGGVSFLNDATAGQASIVNKSGGVTLFWDDSTASSATVVNEVGGRLDISRHSGVLAIGSVSGDGNVFLGANGLTLGGLGLNDTIGGVIQDGGAAGGSGGSLTKTGAGTLTLSGVNTYTGTTTVSGGALLVNGSIASSMLTTVNAGGTLGGNGTVGDTVIDGGVLSPGNSIGSLTVAGNLTLTAAATYMVEVSPAASDFTHVTGAADLGGATVAAHFAPGSYVEKRYTILTADGGLGGTAFSGPVNTDLPANFQSALAYDGDNAFLDLTLSFRQGGLNSNQQQVADTLADVFNATGGIPLAFGALDARGLSQASGEVATSAAQAAFDAQSQFLNTMTDPFADGQGAASAPASPAMSYAAEGPRRTNAYAALMTKTPPALQFERRWRVFGAAYGGSASISGNAAIGSHEATSRIYGGIGGAAYALSPATQLGFALGGGGTAFGLSDGLGSGRSGLFQAGVFARHGFAAGGYLAGAFAYGWHDVTTGRVAPTGEHLAGAYKANVLSGRIEAGWRIETTLAGVTPYAAAQAISYRLPTYREQGNGAADSFALAYAGRDVTATRSELGLRFERATMLGEALLTLRGRAAWAHNFDTGRALAATFQALPGTGFLVNGATMAPDAALVSAGAEIGWGNGLSFAASFEGEFSDTTTGYAGKGMLKYAW